MPLIVALNFCPQSTKSNLAFLLSFFAFCKQSAKSELVKCNKKLAECKIANLQNASFFCKMQYFFAKSIFLQHASKNLQNATNIQIQCCRCLVKNLQSATKLQLRFCRCLVKNLQNATNLQLRFYRFLVKTCKMQQKYKLYLL